MRDFLTAVTEAAVPVIDVLAVIIIVIGTIEAFIMGVKVAASSANGHEARTVWLRYARWLVAGLTFQLAADIVETAVTPTWDDIGRLAAIAVVRTFLNYFLERDLKETRDRQHEPPGAPSAA